MADTAVRDAILAVRCIRDTTVVVRCIRTLQSLYAVSGHYSRTLYQRHYSRCTLYQDTIVAVRCIRTLQTLYQDTTVAVRCIRTLQSLYAVSGHYTHVKTLHLPTWCTLRSLQATLAVCCIRDLRHVRCIGDATFAGAVSQLRATVHA